MNTGKLSEVRVKISAARHGNPARDLNIILIVGEYGKTTVTALFSGIVKEVGKTAVTVSSETEPGFDRSIDAFFSTLARVKKSQTDFVVIEATDRLLTLGVTAQLTVGTLILTSNHPKAEMLLRQSPRHVVAPSQLDVPEGLIEPYKHISYGEDDSAEAQMSRLKLYRKGTELLVTIDHQIRIELATHLVGKTNAVNVLTAAATAYVLGFDTSRIQEGIADVESVPGNFVAMPTDKAYNVYYDGATSVQSMLMVIESARALANRRLIVVVTRETVSDEDIARLKETADRLIIVQPTERDTISGVDQVLSPEEAIHKGERAAKQDDVLLVFAQPPEVSVGETVAA